MALAFALILTAGLSLACLVGFRWATTHPFFSVSDAAVLGNSRLGDEYVLQSAGIIEGENIFQVSLTGIERGLASEPWIQSAMVKRVLPGRIEITITERKPAFWKLAGEELFYADSAGRTIAPVEAEKFTSLPLLRTEGPVTREISELQGTFESAGLPLDPRDADWVQVRGKGEIALYFSEPDLSLTVQADEPAASAMLLAKVWKDLERREELARATSMKAMDGRVWVGMR
jgi:cell division protein FtsQ